MNHYVIGKIEDFPTLTGRVVHIGDRKIAIFRLSNGDIYAVENVCPHQGGPLAEGMISGSYVFCPLHDRKICLEDGKVQVPDHGCVKTLPVYLVGDEIICGAFNVKLSQ